MSEINIAAALAEVEASSVPETVVTPSPEPTAPEAPSEPQAPTPEVPTAATATPEATSENPAVPQVTEEQLYDLPDGRKVDAATLTQEWKNNFLPDYTRKSQALAEIQKAPEQPTTQAPNQVNNPPQDTAPWRDPNWVPQTYAEIVEAAKQDLKAEAQAEQQRIEQSHQQVNQYVEAQLSEIRKIEPNVAEDLLFAHALKYGFADLGAAFKNMQDFSIAVKRTEQRTAANIANRQADPVAVQTQPPSAPDGAVDINTIRDDNMSVLDVLKGLKG